MDSFSVLVYLLIINFLFVVVISSDHGDHEDHTPHWVFILYHKTGFRLTSLIAKPFFEKCDSGVIDCLKSVQPTLQMLERSNITRLNAPEMYEVKSWQDEYKLKTNKGIRFVHFVRDPFDIVLSGYLYHGQTPRPEPEVWLNDRRYNPCEGNLSKTMQYADEISQFVHEYQQNSTHDTIAGAGSHIILNILPSDIHEMVLKAHTMCQELVSKYSSPTYHELLQHFTPYNHMDALLYNKSLDDLVFDGVRIEALRSMFPERNGHILRMAANALTESRSSRGSSRRVFTSEFPVGDRKTFYNSISSLLNFLWHDDLESPRMQRFWGCFNDDVIIEAVIDSAFASSVPEEKKEKATHITVDLMSSTVKEHYKQRLREDPTLGPLLAVVVAILEYTGTTTRNAADQFPNL